MKNDPVDSPKTKRRFLDRFSFAQKFAFICLEFTLCLATALFFFVRDQNEDVDASRRALLGVHYVRPINSLFRLLAEHQQIAQRYVLGDTSLENVLTHLQQRINTAFNNLTENNQVIGPELFTAKTTVDWKQIGISPDKIREQWEALNETVTKQSVETSLVQYDQLYTNLRGLTIAVGDSASLVLGDDIGIYNLTHMLYSDLPYLDINLLNAASISEYVAKSKAITPAHHDALIAEIAIIEHAAEAVSNALWKAVQAQKNFHEDLGLKAALEEPSAQFDSSIANFLSLVKKTILRAEAIDVTSSTIAVASARALNESFQFADLSLEQLDKLLQERYDYLVLERNILIGIVLGLTLIAYLSSYVLLRAMLSPLRNLVAVANQLAKGDLSVRVDIAQSDEIAKVGTALNKMAISIEEILEKLQHAGVELTTSTTEIAAAAKEQETTIVQQETATKQIAVTAKEISATSHEFAKYIQEVTIAAEETSTLASGGKEGLTELKNIMKQMVDATTEIAEKLSSLNEKTGVITGVITTITKVADRTNLLSLNAAIEAHKLGAKGSSFGVIAAEIRRLADQTAFATLDIERVVHQMVTAVSTSVDGVAKFSEEIHQGVKQANKISGLLTKIIAQVQQQTASFESVNQGMETQSSGARQITDSIEELSEAAQQSTASIRQFHAALDHLGLSIKGLQQSVAKLQHEPAKMPPLGTMPRPTALELASSKNGTG